MWKKHFFNIVAWAGGFTAIRKRKMPLGKKSERFWEEKGTRVSRSARVSFAQVSKRPQPFGKEKNAKLFRGEIEG